MRFGKLQASLRFPSPFTIFVAMNALAEKIESGSRVTTEEALRLWREAPLWLLARLADGKRRALNGDRLYYNRNFHIEPTNICAFSCEFCSYRRGRGDAEAWDLTIAQMEDIARAQKDKSITEVHIVGGVHPEHDLEFYVELIASVKNILPHVAVKAYTAVELAYMIRKSGLSLRDGLRRLVEAGMDAIPGGGAEIFDETLRQRLCPEKGTAEEWLEVHRTAHQLGLTTNATMLYGHVESIVQRIDHLDRLRRLQDETGGFSAFIPLKYRGLNNRLAASEAGVVEDMRVLALSRIFLDNVPHIKAYWVMYGKTVAEMALSFGADDLDGTIDDSTRIFSMAGGEERPRLSVAEIENMAASAGLRAVERDTFYNEL